MGQSNFKQEISNLKKENRRLRNLCNEKDLFFHLKWKSVLGSCYREIAHEVNEIKSNLSA